MLVKKKKVVAKKEVTKTGKNIFVTKYIKEVEDFMNKKLVALKKKLDKSLK